MKVVIVGGGIGGLAAYHALHTYLPSNVSIKVYELYQTPNTATSGIGGGIGIVPNGLRALNAISPASVLYLWAHGNVCPYFVVRNQNGTTLGRLGGLHDRILLPRASVHESLLLGMANGVTEWGRKVVEVKETADAAQVVFEDGTVETCDLIIGADGVKSICRQALFGKDAYQAQYDGLTGVGGFAPFSSLTPALQNGIKADQAAMTFSRNGFFGYALSLPLSTPVSEQQVMFWSTYATDTPPSRDLPSEEIRAILMEKHDSWKSPFAGAFRQIIDAAYRPTITDSRFTKWLVLPRYEISPLPYWSSLHGTVLGPAKGAARIILVGDAAHAAAPDSGQGASMAFEDAQMLGLLLRHYLPDSDPLPKVAKAYEDMRIPRVGRILRIGRRQAEGKREISWFKAAVRDLVLWIMCHLPLRVMLWLNPTHLYDVEKEVAKYLAAVAR
ncbi:FAD/NAD(P)-binding domain-containing protein [Guyanagaster necrorhizus]|uniref:FAD/NAD(P)-binding domain-containing protein n=1 Tax=Guyanagaster necrorhizus TaxID=856835 RepID=A0A9P7VNM8_9AGAR|nr:FAD/NAD(P)-binding domain-containing protein [Guyanagaster necrorhizus MCA 3950]KAG7443159.1 FAD/NAD(P)-binding domain-containing protein [Guyanagaster necrorhizus MCA 3950]